MKSLGHYISESESRAESPEPGDVFAFNWREEILIESRIVDVVEDGFVIEGNDHVMALLEQCNCQTEDIARYGPAGDSRGMGLSLSETGIKVDDVDFEQEDTTVDAGEYDYEGDMAKNELHTIVRAARKLAGMLDNDDNMPEWTQKKITKAADYVDTAADYISSQKERGVMEQFQDPSLQDLIKKHKELVRSYNYELQMNDNTHFPYMDEMRDRLKEMWKLIQAKKAADQQSVTEQSQENNPVARAILHRIMMSHPGMLAQHGPEQVMNAVDDVADYIGDVEEIGSSDVSGWVRQVEQMLGGLRESGVNEAATMASVSKLLRHIERHNPTWFDDYGMGEVEDTVVDMAEQGTFSGMTVVDAAALVGQELESLYGAAGMNEAEYQGRKVPLGKPMRGDVAKSKVYVKDPKTGNVKKVNFGDPNMSIKKSNPERRKSFRARHNCDNPGPRTKARYWSCRAW